MAILQKNLHSFFLFSKLKPTMLQNRALQYCTGLHFRHSSFGGRCDSFVDLNFTKNRVSCVSFSDYPKAIRLGSCLTRVDEPRLGTGVFALARSVGVLGNGLLPSSGPYRGALSKRLFCHVTGKVGNFGSKDDKRGVKNSSFNVFNKHKKRAKGNQITGHSSSNSRIAASEDTDVVTSSNHIVEEVSKDVNVSTSKSKPKQQSGSKRRQNKSTDAIATATTNAHEVQPKVSKSTTKKKNTKVAQSDQVPLESESAAVQPKVSKTVSKKKKAKVAQSDQIPLEPEKSLTDAMAQKNCSLVLFPQPSKLKQKQGERQSPKAKLFLPQRLRSRVFHLPLIYHKNKLHRRV